MRRRVGAERRGRTERSRCAAAAARPHAARAAGRLVCRWTSLCPSWTGRAASSAGSRTGAKGVDVHGVRTMMDIYGVGGELGSPRRSPTSPPAAHTSRPGTHVRRLCQVPKVCASPPLGGKGVALPWHGRRGRDRRGGHRRRPHRHQPRQLRVECGARCEVLALEVLQRRCRPVHTRTLRRTTRSRSWAPTGSCTVSPMTGTQRGYERRDGRRTLASRSSAHGELQADRRPRACRLPHAAGGQIEAMHTT